MQFASEHHQAGGTSTWLAAIGLEHARLDGIDESVANRAMTGGRGQSTVPLLPNF